MEDMSGGYSAKTKAETEDQSTRSHDNKEEAKQPESK